MPPLRPTLSAFASCIVLTGCTLVGGGPREPAPTVLSPVSVPSVQHFDGSVVLGGQEFALRLELTRDDPPRYGALLLIPEIALEARGAGTLRNDRLRLDLTYGESGCEGKLTLEAGMPPADGEGSGTLSARDCTGGESGPVRLRRRSITGAQQPDSRVESPARGA